MDIEPRANLGWPTIIKRLEPYVTGYNDLVVGCLKGNVRSEITSIAASSLSSHFGFKNIAKLEKGMNGINKKPLSVRYFRKDGEPTDEIVQMDSLSRFQVLLLTCTLREAGKDVCDIITMTGVGSVAVMDQSAVAQILVTIELLQGLR